MTGFRAVGLGHDGDDGEDEDVAERGEVRAAEEGGADADEVLALVRVLGDFEGDGADAGDDFGGGERVAGAVISCFTELRWAGGLELTGR